MDKKSRDLVMGKLYLKNKDYKMAEKSLSEYLSSNPEDFQALKLSAQVQEHLNDTAKAFDVYERCYLCHPDRKGILLDICRLLLSNDARLDHVDKKKWLRLAAQVFPTNPIVTNLRDSIPTGQDSHSGRASTEDMIMEKLTSLEDRFKNFEDGFKTMLEVLETLASQPASKSLAPNAPAPSSSAPSPLASKPPAAKSPVSSPATFNPPVSNSQASNPPASNLSVFNLTASNPPASNLPVSNLTASKPPASNLPAFSTSALNLSALSSPAPSPSASNLPTSNSSASNPPAFSSSASNPPAFNSSLFKPSPFNPPAFNSPAFTSPSFTSPSFTSPAFTSPSFTSPAFNSPSFNPPVSNPPVSKSPASDPPTSKPIASDPPTSKPPASNPPATNSSASNAPVSNPAASDSSPFKPSPFNPPSFNSTSLNSSGFNLFAESLKKLNLPTEGAWATQKEEPKEVAQESGEGDGDGDNEDDGGVVPTEELPIENTCDMRPIEIKTGEEDENIVFKHRCKLFRFRDKEYKERGLGDIKVLQHKDTGKGRLIMRRDMINLVCLNCWSCKNIERVRDTQVRFAGLDASDGEPELTVFLAKFKTPELTDDFMKHLKDLFAED